MEISILHLTDIHLSEETNLDEKSTALCKVLSHEFTNKDYVFLVISGDIAATGTKQEYEQAGQFIQQIQTHINKTNDGMVLNIVIVPGNHDCNFKYDSQIRKNSIKNVDYKNLGDDYSVIGTCLVVQKDFWEFYQKYGDVPQNKLSYAVSFNKEDLSICFHCQNSSWMSQINEKPGSLFFPVNLLHNDDTGIFDINISVYHHPINWFNPDSEKNNKREFQNYLDKISSIQLIGHEHECAYENRIGIDTNFDSLNFSGAIFNDNNNQKSSGFQIIEISTNNRTGTIKKYILDDSIYICDFDKEFRINHGTTRNFNITKELYKKINQIQIPLSINNGDCKLSDIYIYPDLESIEHDDKYIDSYFDSKLLIGNKKISKCILEGDSQIGKTSLIRMLFLEYYNRGYYPLIVDGTQLKDSKFENIIKQIFYKIYTEGKNEIEKYKQLPKERKILLVDDFQKATNNLYDIQKSINQITQYFGQTIIAIDSVHGMIPQIQAELDGFYSFSIKPFGHKKTNDLITKYFSKKCCHSGEKQILLQKIKFTFDQIRSILGNKVIPSYPIFLLSILQSLENASFDLNETSYGYCYQSLIHYSLAIKANIQNENVGSYINFTKELAFYFLTNNINSLSENDFVEFYNSYSDKFVFQTYDIVKAKLLKSQLLVLDESGFGFGYKYVYYFLAAKHISDIINKDEGKKIISKLFSDIHLEVNANILVFITHHTNDISFINDSLISAMIPFEKIDAITLNKGGSYYTNIKDISSKISSDLIDHKRLPEDEREKQMIIKDKEQRVMERNQQDNLSPDELNEVTIPFLQAFRSIDIVGQIIKNRKGSLPKDNLIELISEIYLTGFRTVGYLGAIFDDAKDILTEELNERIKDSDSREAIENKVNSFFQFISLQTCLGVFTKLVYSVGIKDLKERFVTQMSA